MRAVQSSLIATLLLLLPLLGCVSSERDGSRAYGVVPPIDGTAGMAEGDVPEAPGADRDVAGGELDDTAAPAPGDVGPDGVPTGPTGDAGTPIQPADAALPADISLPSPDPGEYAPDWVNHPDRLIKKCLELVPAVCNKIADCEIPFADAIAGFCPPLADGGKDLLILGCEQIKQLGPGNAAFDLIAGVALDMLEKCIDDYQCDLPTVLSLAQKVAKIVQDNGGSGDINQILAAVLPEMLKLVLDECGASLPIPF